MDKYELTNRKKQVRISKRIKDCIGIARSKSRLQELSELRWLAEQGFQFLVSKSAQTHSLATYQVQYIKVF